MVIEKTIPIDRRREDIVELAHSYLHGLNDVVTVGGEVAHVVAVDDENAAIFSSPDHLARRAGGVIRQEYCGAAAQIRVVGIEPGLVIGLEEILFRQIARRQAQERIIETAGRIILVDTGDEVDVAR